MINYCADLRTNSKVTYAARFMDRDSSYFDDFPEPYPHCSYIVAACCCRCSTNAILHRHLASLAMGSSHSSTSYSRFQNDFELVIRATKDLEFLLETEFGAPSGKNIGLQDKITHAERNFGLSRYTVKQMRYLVTGMLKNILLSSG